MSPALFLPTACPSVTRHTFDIEDLPHEGGFAEADRYIAAVVAIRKSEIANLQGGSG